MLAAKLLRAYVPLVAAWTCVLALSSSRDGGPAATSVLVVLRLLNK